jgi:transcription antitermination factor NusA-like protein
MAEIIEILHNIEYKVQDQELQKAVSTVQKNVSSIENLTKRQIKLANAYDKTMAGDESRRTRLTGLIAKNTSEINKNTKSLENSKK